MAGNVRDNEERQRFELEADGNIAFSIYKRADKVLTIMHTEVPNSLEGRGASRATFSADAASGRHCCIGPTTAAKFEKVLSGRDGTRAHGPISPSRHNRVDCSRHQSGNE